MNKCVIISGAEINNYEKIKSLIKNNDYIVICDKGLRHLEKLNIFPNLIVGDFDSYKKPNLNVEIIELPKEKDDTDTVYAVKEMINRGFENFLLLGVVGNRLDHTIGNLSILLMLHNAGKSGIIVDDYSEMQVVGREKVYISDNCKYFSLLNIFGEVENLNIQNAKYNLKNGKIRADYQYAISNEVLPNKITEIKLESGFLLLVKVYDE